jgi:hypothetical protein
LQVLLLIGAVWGSGAAQSQETASNDTRIHLEAAVFDPLQGPGPAPEALRLGAGIETNSWLVQFRAPLTRQQRELLIKEYGLKLTSYIPNLAYLERIPRDTVEGLRQSNLVRAIVAYQPAYKISPRIGRLRFRSAERRNMRGLLLRAVLFDDVDPSSVAESLKALPGVVIARRARRRASNSSSPPGRS